MSDPPSGTVTFLFTDIEGSTKRWEAHPVEMRAALARHDEILGSLMEATGGYVFKTIGDAFCAAFESPADALQAALSAQLALLAEQWAEELVSLRVRMALHTGVAEERDGDYFGQPVNRVARLLSTGHGGQVLLSAATYETVRDSLPNGARLLDLGEHGLKDLFRPEHIYQLAAPGLLSQFPHLNTLDSRPNNLPRQPTPLIGREKELARLATLLRKPDVVLVTLTGAGGSGKTRLALQVAADLLDDFRDGVWLVELATISEPKLVVPTIAQVLGVKEAAGQPLLDILKAYLKEKQLLLVLDNFEQVVGAADEIGRLLAACSKVKALVTSRVPLKISGEKEHPVPPLQLPDATHLPSLAQLTQYESVRLFIERATDVKPDFEVTNNKAPAVAEICVRLDGLPLAIELAAARVKMLPPQALLAHLSSCLKILTGGRRDLSARQQTLRGAIDWSYDLLDQREKQLFRRMAVFSGGRTLEAVEAVCNYDAELQVDVFDGVQALIDHSLLQQREGRDGEPRFWMLETIHEYAREKLEESPEASALHREHALYFMRLAEEAEPEFDGADPLTWVRQLDEEKDNFRAAFTWFITGRDDEGALRLASALAPFWKRTWTTHMAEVCESYAKALNLSYEKGGGDSLARAKALLAASFDLPASQTYTHETMRSFAIESLAMARRLGDPKLVASALCVVAQHIHRFDRAYDQAVALIEEGLSLSWSSVDKRGQTDLLTNLAWILNEEGNYVGAVANAQAALKLAQETQSKWGISQAVRTLGLAYWRAGNYEQAQLYLEQALEIDRDLGTTIAGSLWNLGGLLARLKKYSQARPLLMESLEMQRREGNQYGVANLVGWIGYIEMKLGNAAEARRLTNQYVRMLAELKIESSTVRALEDAACVECAAGSMEKATRLFGAAEASRTAHGIVLSMDEQEDHQEYTALAHEALGDEAYHRLRHEGLSMSLEQAIEYALEQRPEREMSVGAEIEPPTTGAELLEEP